jgi:hypothetical protein
VAGPDGDPDHPILPNPFQWELVEFTFHRDPADVRRSFIDLVLARDGVNRRLRFFGPRDVELTRGLPSSSGLYIQDVSSRQMEGVEVRVGSFEPVPCVPSFWAASVEEAGDGAVGRARIDAELRTALDEARRDAQAVKDQIKAEAAAAAEIQAERDRIRREIEQARDAALAEISDRAAAAAAAVVAAGEAAEPAGAPDRGGKK